MRRRFTLAVIRVALAACAAFGCTVALAAWPSDCTPVAYIQGDGSAARIVTDYTPQVRTDTIVVEFALTKKDATGTIWCARASSTTDATLSLFWISNANLRFDYCNSMDGAFGSSVTVGTRYVVTNENNAVTWSGGEGKTYAKVDDFEAAGGPMTFFASYYGGVNSNLKNYSSHRLYSVKIYRDGELLHELVPAADGNGNGTLVDVCDEAMTITRYGTFTVGAAVSYMTVAAIPAQTATGYAVCPSPTVTSYLGATLARDTDYTLTYDNNVLAGEARVTVTPIGAFAESLPACVPTTASFTIVSPYDLSASRYVQDGLLNHWEAIENAGSDTAHDSAATAWVDLCGGTAWTIAATYGSWQDGNALYCNGNGVAGSRATVQNGIVTADIALRCDSGTGDRAVAWMSGQRTGGYAAFYYFYGGTLNLVREKGVAMTVGENMTVAAVYTLESGLYGNSVSTAYKNGAAATVVAGSDFCDAGANLCTIGGRGSGSARNFKGRLYGMRFYSRELTAEEVRTNAVLDSVRYFGESLLAVGDIPIQSFDGVHPCEPALAVTNRLTEIALVAGTDYRVVYRDNAASGTATAQVIGLGAHAGLSCEQTFVVVSSEFTTPGELDDTCTVAYSSSAGGEAVFTGSVSVYGDGTVHTVCLYLGTDPENLARTVTDGVTAEGTFSLSSSWPTYGVPVYYRLAYETSDGTETYVSMTSVGSQTPWHSATYTWKTSVTGGSWCDAANWTVSGANVSNPIGYPFYGYGSVAVFPAATSATVTLQGGETCLYVQPAAGAKVRLQGAGTDPAAFTCGCIRMYSASNVSFVYDHVAMTWLNTAGSTDSACERLGPGSVLRLENGSTVTIEGGGYGTTFANNACNLQIAGGSTYKGATQQGTSFMGNSTCTIDNGTLVMRNYLNMCSGVSGATAPSTWTFSGAAPRIEAQSDLRCAGSYGGNLVFVPGATGFARSVLYAPNAVVFSDSTASSPAVSVSVPSTAAVWQASERVECVLIEAPKGINTNAVRFAVLKRPYAEFAFLPKGSDTPTSLVFRYVPPGVQFTVR